MTYDSSILLNITRDTKTDVRVAAAKCGLSLSAFIREAIDEKIEREKN